MKYKNDQKPETTRKWNITKKILMIIIILMAAILKIVIPNMIITRANVNIHQHEYNINNMKISLFHN